MSSQIKIETTSYATWLTSLSTDSMLDACPVAAGNFADGYTMTEEATIHYLQYCFDNKLVVSFESLFPIKDMAEENQFKYLVCSMPLVVA